MRHAIVVIALLALLLLGGCTAQAVGTGASVPASYAPRAEVLLQDSLFKEDTAVISNEDMARVLDSEIQLPERGKLAVVRFGSMPYWWGWSEDFVRMNQEIDKSFLDRLATSSRVKQVAYLPSLVTPKQMSLPYLRQAAGRFQAHLLLIYRTTNRSYQRSKVFAADETKAYCTVEAVLLDTRTGIVPFSTVISQEYSAKQGDKDTNFSETIAKANQQAIGKAWMTLADEAVNYLNGLPANATTRPTQ
ncbi:MAG: hypothetical protein H0T11_06545 [Chthoniobacterales bacterium]|nr:hypothetical protein [Chthoniobacterales bacterium]